MAESDCGCTPKWQKAKPNGTCATCGGWLPGQRPPSLVERWRKAPPVNPCAPPLPGQAYPMEGGEDDG